MSKCSLLQRVNSVGMPTKMVTCYTGQSSMKANNSQMALRRLLDLGKDRMVEGVKLAIRELTVVVDMMKWSVGSEAWGGEFGRWYYVHM